MVYEIKDNDLTINDIENICNTDDIIFMPESDYGLGEIHFENGKYNLYSIPMYGGKPTLELIESNAQLVLSALESWC